VASIVLLHPTVGIVNVAENVFENCAALTGRECLVCTPAIGDFEDVLRNAVRF
jgi:hypothetical protein